MGSLYLFIDYKIDFIGEPSIDFILFVRGGAGMKLSHRFTTEKN
jgi:hypothetical protein